MRLYDEATKTLQSTLSGGCELPCRLTLAHLDLALSTGMDETDEDACALGAAHALIPPPALICTHAQTQTAAVQRAPAVQRRAALAQVHVEVISTHFRSWIRRYSFKCGWLEQVVMWRQGWWCLCGVLALWNLSVVLVQSTLYTLFVVQSTFYEW